MSAPNGCVVTPVITKPTGSPVLPQVVHHATVVLAHGSSLPFTGADVQELAVIGLGAVLAGGLLLKRRYTRARI